MTQYGYALSSEEHAPKDLVAHAQRAESLGFDFLAISDHYHPWLEAQGHSPFVWSVIGALAATTTLPVAVGVTCPMMRMHPAVVAQAAATSACLLDGRFTFGVGSGEALNEHILGDRWPSAPDRLEMLEEAVGLIRALWTGETVSHEGKHYRVENARLFDVPASPPPVVVSAFGPKATKVAAAIGDGLWNTSPMEEAVAQFRDAGGSGPIYGQFTMCWGEDAGQARKLAAQQWANTAVPGQLSQDLPTWVHFEQASQLVTPEIIAEKIPCGPDVDAYVQKARAYVDAGFSHIYFHQVGSDQEGFFRFWERELRPRLP